MWTAWGKSPRRSPSFSYPSFKDVESLVNDKEKPEKPDRSGKPHPRRVSSIFHRVWIATSTLRSWSSHPNGEKKIVLYFTSLHVIRKTFDDCRVVRSIFRGFRVSVDERDLSMDPRFMQELQQLLGDRMPISLPAVFISGKYVGGAEEIMQLHESGELKRIMEGFPTQIGPPCESCGGVRFVLCASCNGSHKCYLDKGGFRICTICNENGLVRCPLCWA